MIKSFNFNCTCRVEIARLFLQFQCNLSPNLQHAEGKDFRTLARIINMFLSVHGRLALLSYLI